MGNLEHILPSLYAEAQQGSSGSSSTSSVAAAELAREAGKQGVAAPQSSQPGSATSEEAGVNKDHAPDEL
jgi:hypothetical protein